ncbi:MAG: hypothetical protein LR015_13755 [Verrucomicrobia bacterium]|nr:hypothetical protein [Verrucomicrobiota bacterium]
MIQNHTSLSQPSLTIPLVVERMQDENPQNRRMALRQSGQQASVQQLLEAHAQQSAAHDALWDRELARQLAHHPNNRNSQIVLENFLESDDPATQTEAALSLLMLDPASLRNSPAIPFLMERPVADESVRRVFQIFVQMPPDRAQPVLQKLLAARAGNVRLEALRYWAMLGMPLPALDSVLSLLLDENPEVRRTMQNWLQARAHFVTGDLLLAMARSPHRDLRELVFRFVHLSDNDTLRLSCWRCCWTTSLPYVFKPSNCWHIEGWMAGSG